MKVRIAGQCAIALILVFAGWVVGRAQTTAPDFELAVDAPSGETTLKCLRGCELVWVERGLNANASRMATFTYKCTAPRCSSGRIGVGLTSSERVLNARRL